jgi:type IV secretion system protein TrbI
VAVKLTPAPPHTLLAWTWIDARLETPIDSDHSGDVLARVSHPARDLTQTEILIPAGSLLHGTQEGTNRSNVNDTSLIVVWDDLEFPNGAHFPLPKMTGFDESGAPGISGEVNRHLNQIWLPAVFTSAITAGIMLAQNPTYGSYQGYDSTQQASGAFASSMGGFATRALGSNLTSIHPTVRRDKGAMIKVMVNRNFTFPGPYQE